MDTPSPDARSTSLRLERQDLAAEIRATHQRLLGSALFMSIAGVATAVAISAGSGITLLTGVAMAFGSVQSLRHRNALRRQTAQLARMDAGDETDPG